jgi:UPF0042 nucleotide-binding protein
MRIVIITGMSGSGKRTGMKMLEDIGFYCIDNLPAGLVSQFVELLAQPGNEYNKVALGIDVRTAGSMNNLAQVIKNLKKSGHDTEVLFLEASDKTLIKRYKETRRVHPLAGDGTIEEGIRKEREELDPIRKQATYIIDTSNLLTREFKAELDGIFRRNEQYANLNVSIVSFGFKYGIPADADLVFDVRFLPNPFYIDELKAKTGLDKEVRDYVCQFKETEEFLDKLEDMLNFLMPNYVKEGKYNLVVAIGCTGGKHRSVTLAEGLYARMKSRKDFGFKIIHRDVTVN